MLHGGDIYRNKVNMDFSVNINPLGMPDAVKDALLQAVEHCGEYPDIKAEALKKGIAQRTGVCPERIVAGNGASELFCAIVHAVRPRRTVIPVPSFFGYERAARASGGELIFYPMKAETGYQLEEGLLEYLTEEVDLLFLANPNNPVGNLIESRLLEKIAEHCGRKGITLVIDECFLEFTGKEEQYSYKDKLDRYPGVIVVRAFTKIYAIPGVRLGYLLCSGPEWKRRIEEQLPEWNLSVFAQRAGVAACGEEGFAGRTAWYVSRERQYLIGEMEKLGIKVYPSDANYLLLETEHPLYEGLLEEGILIRDCGNYKGLDRGFYRIAVKNREENELLLNAVREILRAHGAVPARFAGEKEGDRDGD
ncbi:histidinol-phosphate aminotransferase [Anaerotaenia torta]|uniref:pyridoxal phosphate-dependent aminotransferase n=1 Tax=Anaerotaenia torta TaxID=433293 RepID=UPI003D1C91C1